MPGQLGVDRRPRALSTIRVDLGASIEQLEWTVNAYNLSFAVLLITGAALGDRFGRSNLYAIGLAVFAVASAACALSPGVGWLIAARAVQGAGSALIMPLGLALLTVAFPPERRGAAIGIFSAITGLAVASGPFVAGAIVEGIGWRWIFRINVPIGLLSVPFVLTRMKKSLGPDTSLDIPGLALVSAGALGVVWGWCATFASLFGAVFFYAQLLQTALGFGPLDAGLRLLPWTAPFLTVAPVAGALADRIGERPLMVSGLSLQAVGMAWLALIAEPGMAYAFALPGRRTAPAARPSRVRPVPALKGDGAS